MTHLTITIETGNAAFHLLEAGPEEEIARILNECAAALRNGERPTSLRDLFGNTVGQVTYEEAS